MKDPAVITRKGWPDVDTLGKESPEEITVEQMSHERES